MIRTKFNFAKAGILCLFVFSALLINAQSNSTPPTFFSETLINDMLSHRDAAGVRIYNVVMSEGSSELTTMAIGIKSDGSELSGGLFAKKYKVNEGVSGNEGLINGVSKNTATALCAGVTAQNLVSFSADFPRATLQSMMNVKDANGVQVIQTSAGEDATFEASSAELANGAWTAPKDAEKSTCTDPCPSYCDSDNSHYVNR